VLGQRAVDAVVHRVEQRELHVGEGREHIEREPRSDAGVIATHDALQRIANTGSASSPGGSTGGMSISRSTSHARQAIVRDQSV
jgi:hypothetical protein